MGLHELSRNRPNYPYTTEDEEEDDEFTEEDDGCCPECGSDAYKRTQYGSYVQTETWSVGNRWSDVQDFEDVEINEYGEWECVNGHQVDSDEAQAALDGL